MQVSRVLLGVTVLLTVPSAAICAEDTRRGTVTFHCAECEATLPAQYRLPPHAFDYQIAPVATTSRTLRISKVTFPSPVVTREPRNNTVHCEFFCPVENVPAAGATGADTPPVRRPAVIMLHILGGDFDLSRLFCRALASRGVAALFLQMPYYGERRQPDSPARMVSADAEEVVRGMTQAVLDCRQAAAWLAAQENVDPSQLGIMGISLGGITGALAASIEPRFNKACFILAGGEMGEVAWTSEELAPLREQWLASGRSKEQLFATLKSVDPVTYARPQSGREILMLNARRDEVVPTQCTTALWRAFGEPRIVWWDAGHYSAARYMFDGVAMAVEFFQPPTAGAQSTAK
ncbi:MAG: alpha/beta hydrolase [Pirellulales bacterium]